MKRYYSISQLTENQVRSFWSQIDRRGPAECWLWLGHAAKPNRNSKPYGVFQVVVNGKTLHLRPHRISYTLTHGPIPAGLDLDHVYGRCTSTLCCNPDHTEAVPIGVNVQRYYLSRTHCNRGHEITQHGHSCRRCNNLRLREKRSRQKSKIEPIALQTGAPLLTQEFGTTPALRATPPVPAAPYTTAEAG